MTIGIATQSKPIHLSLTTKITATPIITKGKIIAINTNVIFIYIVLKSEASMFITFPISAFLIIN